MAVLAHALVITAQPWLDFEAAVETNLYPRTGGGDRDDRDFAHQAEEAAPHKDRERGVHIRRPASLKRPLIDLVACPAMLAKKCIDIQEYPITRRVVADRRMEEVRPIDPHVGGAGQHGIVCRAPHEQCPGATEQEHQAYAADDDEESSHQHWPRGGEASRPRIRHTTSAVDAPNYNIPIKPDA